MIAVDTSSECVTHGVKHRAMCYNVPSTRHPNHDFLCRPTYDLVLSLTVSGTRWRSSRSSFSRDDHDGDDTLVVMMVSCECLSVFTSMLCSPTSVLYHSVIHSAMSSRDNTSDSGSVSRRVSACLATLTHCQSLTRHLTYSAS